MHDRIFAGILREWDPRDRLCTGTDLPGVLQRGDRSECVYSPGCPLRCVQDMLRLIFTCALPRNDGRFFGLSEGRPFYCTRTSLAGSWRGDRPEQRGGFHGETARPFLGGRKRDGYDIDKMGSFGLCFGYATDSEGSSWWNGFSRLESRRGANAVVRESGRLPSIRAGFAGYS